MTFLHFLHDISCRFFLWILFWNVIESNRQGLGWGQCYLCFILQFKWFLYLYRSIVRIKKLRQKSNKPLSALLHGEYKAFITTMRRKFATLVCFDLLVISHNLWFSDCKYATSEPVSVCSLCSYYHKFLQWLWNRFWFPFSNSCFWFLYSPVFEQLENIKEDSCISLNTDE